MGGGSHEVAGLSSRTPSRAPSGSTTLDTSQVDARARSRAVARALRRHEELRSQAPASRTHTSVSGSTSSVTRHRGQIKLVLSRLQREADNLRAASPAVVLGVPAESPPELVAKAAERMRVRYTVMSQDQDLPEEARQLARQILAAVDEASRVFSDPRYRAVDAGAGLPGMSGDEEELLARGRELITRRDWEEADRVLSEARSLRLDHAGILSNLAWARYNNPRYPEARRAREARELLLLAEQFDPHHGEGQYYLAEVLFFEGNNLAALKRAGRAVKANPEDPMAQRLYKRLKSLQG